MGKAIPLLAGSEVTYIACGETVPHAVQAADILTRQDVSCGVISLPYLRPFDEAAVLAAARRC